VAARRADSGDHFALAVLPLMTRSPRMAAGEKLFAWKGGGFAAFLFSARFPAGLC
jgi:hypothetical protein